MNSVLIPELFKNSSKVMYVKLFVNDNNLKEKYQESLMIHNNKISSTIFPDAGFDLFVPESIDCLYENLVKINFGVKSSAIIIDNNGNKFPSGFYLYARSSLGSKTKLRLANSVGIIDSGYRGELIGCFDCVKDHSSNKTNMNTQSSNVICNYDYHIDKYDKLIQICAPDLCPIYIELVDNEVDLSEQTDRGSGGFGSTGR